MLIIRLVINNIVTSAEFDSWVFLSVIDENVQCVEKFILFHVCSQEIS